MAKSATARKPRSDSVAEMTRIQSVRARDLVPPAHVPLKKHHQPFWNSVVAEFATADWTDHTLELAAILARNMYHIEQNQKLLEDEGFIVVNAKGTKVENSRARAVQSLLGQSLGLRRSLALHAKAQHGSNRDAGKKLGANKATEAAGQGDDDLLA